ncbi:hypothetical protein [Stakelama marina]|uniref:DUF1440 domain-containing protein n=1 Tax=Stakelama marina TaxID=2826939 RepID=A0A8T4I7W0_9SPHN|nr:hypothetical protein [Stakelama marina]MBR0551078.1 hypothetical protein [Stakelama marina]
MRASTAGIIGGIVGGVGLTAALIARQRSHGQDGIVAKNARELLDRSVDREAIADDRSNHAIDQANKLLASATFSAGYSAVRYFSPRLPATGVGAAYGIGLYATNIALPSPIITIGETEETVPLRVSLERAGLHALFGLATALIASALSSRDD